MSTPEEHEGESTPAPEASTPGVRHERRDVVLKPVLIGGITMAVVTLVSMGVLIFAFDLLRWRQNRNETPQLPIAKGQNLFNPPGPQLQADESTDIVILRENEQRQLNSLGWVSSASGIVHIPLKDAMAQAAQEIPEWETPK